MPTRLLGTHHERIGHVQEVGGRQIAISRGVQRQSIGGQVNSSTAVWLQRMVATCDGYLVVQQREQRLLDHVRKGDGQYLATKTS